MSSLLDQQVGRARWRLTGNLFFERFALGLFAAAGVWLLTILVVQLFALPVPFWHGAWIAVAAGLLAGLIGALLARPTPLQAAVVLDSAAGLKERLSTALAVGRTPDDFARAAVADAERTAGRVHVPSHVRYRAPSLWPWSAATLVAALILARFMPVVDVFGADKPAEAAVPRALVEAEHKAIKAEFEDRVRKIAELAKDNPKLEDLVKDVQPLELPDEPTLTPDDVRREAARRIDDVREKLKRELEAGENDTLKNAERMFTQLNQPGGEPSNDKLTQALASGDLQGAKQALQEMSKQIQDAAKNAQDPEAQQRLAELQNQFQKLSDQLSKMGDSVALQKELENKGGLSEEDAKKLLDQLSKMDAKQLQKELQKALGSKGVNSKQLEEIARKIQQNQQARKQCQNLAQAMQKAAQACQQCRSPGGGQEGSSQAANALSDAAAQLSDLEMAEQMMADLQAQLAEMDSMRDSVCKGGMCPGRGDGRIGPQGPNAGLGYGERIGREKVAYNRTPQKVKSRYQGGSIIGRMLVEGPQLRGEVSAEDLAAVASEVRDAQDAVEREQVPRQYAHVAREYFERLAGLMPRTEGTGKPADDGSEKDGAEKAPDKPADTASDE